ncbi:hypothetical protein OIDMADRAFT_18568 [Oidiodendron maius Zn]|uniref:Uncharacterized protein n=1 Tax=Oidiodendron maius (strain Zn) TaxID=913774 RepID=A0A0C3DHZ3_OIDMZ|nr:hypothetical protein OIDMADRAFT_18568 [Oidiodendron maius Zn]
MKDKSAMPICQSLGPTLPLREKSANTTLTAEQVSTPKKTADRLRAFCYWPDASIGESRVMPGDKTCTKRLRMGGVYFLVWEVIIKFQG